MSLKNGRTRSSPVLWIVLALVILAALGAWYFCGANLASQPGPTVAPTADPQQELYDRLPSSAEIQLAQEEEATRPREVESGSFKLTYAGSHADKIKVRELPETEADDMAFYVDINGQGYLLFTLCSNSGDGDLVTVLTDASGNKVPMAFKIESVPDGLSAEDARTFSEAQEAVNEVVSSLVLSE